MGRSWQYSPSRRLAMQSAMCIVLGVTVGAAALVDRWKTPGGIRLGQPVPVERIRIRLPDAWRQRVIVHGRDESNISELRADERADDQESRVISVSQQQLETDIKAEEFLDAQDHSRLIAARGRAEPVKLGPYPGVAREAVEQTEQKEMLFDFSACTILDGGWVIYVEMIVPSDPTPADKELFQQVLQSIQPAAEGSAK